MCDTEVKVGQVILTVAENGGAEGQKAAAQEEKADRQEGKAERQQAKPEGLQAGARPEGKAQKAEPEPTPKVESKPEAVSEPAGWAVAPEPSSPKPHFPHRPVA